MKVPQTGNIIVPPRPQDYLTGAIVYQILLEDGDWHKYEPTDEKQYRQSYFDTMSCTTFSFLNVLEMQFRYMIEKGKIPAVHIDFLQLNGYFDENGHINFSERFTAIMSGTTKTGNYFQKVGDSGRNDGLLPQSKLPFGEAKTWDEWHNPNDITLEHKNLAKKFKEFFEIQYEFVFFDNEPTWSDESVKACTSALKQAPLQGAIPFPGTHAISITSISPSKEYGIYDSYPPYDSEKKWSAPVHYAMKVVLTVKPFSVTTTPVKKTTYKYFSQAEIDKWKLQPAMWEMLDRARADAGVPFVINSGFRDKDKNESVGGVEGSAHTKGLAADIRCLNSSDRMKIVSAALKAGFVRIGVADTFIHLDCDTTKPQSVMWLY